MIDMQALGHEPVFGSDHVCISIMWKMPAQTIARFGRTAVSDIVRQDDVVLRDIQKLTRLEQNVTELRHQELFSAAARSMHDEDRVCDMAFAIALGLTKRRVMHVQLWKALAIGEVEVRYSEIALMGSLADEVTRVDNEGHI